MVNQLFAQAGEALTQKLQDSTGIDVDFSSIKDQIGHVIKKHGELGTEGLARAALEYGFIVADTMLDGAAYLGGGPWAGAGVTAVTELVKKNVLALFDNALAKTDEEGKAVVSHFAPGDFVTIELGEHGAAEKRRRLGFMQTIGDGFQYVMSSQWAITEDIEQENEQFADAARLDILGLEKELDPNVVDERTNAEKLATSKAAHRARRKVDIGVVVERDANGWVLVKDFEMGGDPFPASVSDVHHVPAIEAAKLALNPTIKKMNDLFFESINKFSPPQVMKQVTGASTIKGALVQYGLSNYSMVELLKDGRAKIEDQITKVTKYVDHNLLEWVQSDTTNQPLPGVPTGFMQSFGFHSGEFVWWQEDKWYNDYALGVIESIGVDRILVISTVNGLPYRVKYNQVQHVNTNIYTQVDTPIFAEFQLAVNEGRADQVVKEMAQVLFQEHTRELEADIHINSDWFSRTDEPGAVVAVQLQDSNKPQLDTILPQNTRGPEADKRRLFESRYGRIPVDARKMRGPVTMSTRDLRRRNLGIL